MGPKKPVPAVLNSADDVIRSLRFFTGISCLFALRPHPGGPLLPLSFRTGGWLRTILRQTGSSGDMEKRIDGHFSLDSEVDDVAGRQGGGYVFLLERWGMALQLLEISTMGLRHETFACVFAD